MIAPDRAAAYCSGCGTRSIFLAARGEQYLPALVFFAALPFVDMIIALKLLIVVVWVGAGVLQVRQALLQRRAADGQQQPVRAVQVDQAGSTTATSPRTCGRRGWRTVMAHGGGTRRGDRRPAGPAVLHEHVASPSRPRWSWSVFHLFIISTFPLAVPLEWNVLFAYAAVFLFLGFPNWDGYGAVGHVLAVAGRW